MTEAMETTTSPPPPSAGRETFEAPEVIRTEGSTGSAGEARSKEADEFLAYGSSDKRLRAKGYRGGDESVIGEDERIRVADTDKYPWRMVAALRLLPRPPRTGSFIGTGWFIGPKTLLTAGHCVHSPGDFGGWIGSIEVSPGRNGATYPFKTTTATRFSSLKVWEDKADPDFDIGCIHLDEPLGDEVGYFKIASLSDDDLKDRLVNVSGYPADLDGGTRQYFHVNRLLKTGARRLYYDVDTYGGQSGSPVWIQNGPGDHPLAVGVHAYGVGGATGIGLTANSGPRLIPEVVATIQQWLAKDAQ